MLQVKLSGDRQTKLFFDKLAKALDPVEILDEAGAVLLNRIRTRFLSQLDPDNQKWPISFAAILRARTGRGGGTLFDTGTLFHSIQLFADGPNQRSIGTDVSYGVKHQLGLEGLPQRKFLGFSEEDQFVANQLVLKRLHSAL